MKRACGAGELSPPAPQIFSFLGLTFVPYSSNI